jgi:transcriptional regulator with XRE-family HTH domain
MDLANNIKTIREKQNLMQKEIAIHIGVDKSTYSKIEKGLRDVTVIELDKMSKLFNLSVDQIINYEDNLVPKEVVIEDKSSVEQLQLIQQLEDDDKQTIFKLIEKMLTNKKFKDFFAKNVAML